jgi:hypothetical protein
MTMHGMVVRLMSISLIPVLNRALCSDRYIDLFRMMVVGDQVMAQENPEDKGKQDRYLPEASHKHVWCQNTNIRNLMVNPIG